MASLGERQTKARLLEHPLLIAAGVIAMVWAARAFATACDILLLIFFSVVIATLFSFPMQVFRRIGFPRGIGVILTLVLLCGIGAGIGFATSPLISSQLDQIREQLPKALDWVQHWFVHAEQKGPLGKLSGAGAGHGAPTLQQGLSKVVSGVGSKILPAAFGIGEALITVILLLAMAAFLIHTPETYRRGIRKLVPRHLEGAFDEGWHRVGHGLRRWIGGIVVSMLLMGAVTAIGLWLAGIPGWYTLALLTFFGTFVPYLGAIASAIPGLAMALTQGPAKLAVAVLVYLGVHFIEGYIVQPLVMRRAVELPPALLLGWQALMGAVFGILGIIVATPLLAVVKIATEYYYVERKLHKPAEEQPARAA